jgi:hypothetical protein
MAAPDTPPVAITTVRAGIPAVLDFYDVRFAVADKSCGLGDEHLRAELLCFESCAAGQGYLWEIGVFSFWARPAGQGTRFSIRTSALPLHEAHAPATEGPPIADEIAHLSLVNKFIEAWAVCNLLQYWDS